MRVFFLLLIPLPFQSQPYRFDDSVKILEHLMVPEPNYAQTFTFKMCCPASISVLTMLPTVQLNDKLRLNTEKIHNERPNRSLPPEFPAEQLPVAQGRPDFLLNIRRIAP